MLCFAVVKKLVLIGSRVSFTLILQDCFTGTGLYDCPSASVVTLPDMMHVVRVNQRRTTAKWNQAWIVCATEHVILVPYLYVKSLHLISRSGIHWFHLRVPDLQMSCRDLTLYHAAGIVVPGMATRQHAQFSGQVLGSTSYYTYVFK